MIRLSFYGGLIMAAMSAATVTSLRVDIDDIQSGEEDQYLSQMENGLDTDTNAEADFNFSGVFNKAKGLFTKGVNAVKNKFSSTKKTPPKQKVAAKTQNAKTKQA